MDIGAARSVIGKSELKRKIVTVKKQKRQVQRRSSLFIFGDSTFVSLGKVTLPLATSYEIKPIMVSFYIVQDDVPALFSYTFLIAKSSWRTPLTTDWIEEKLSRLKRMIYVDDLSFR